LLLNFIETEGNEGCNGGLMDNAFQYIKKNKGIGKCILMHSWENILKSLIPDTEVSYPYEALDDTCRYKKLDSGAEDTGYVDVPSGNEEKLKHAIASVGPVRLSIKDMKSYAC
jgi:cathepsin L